MTAFQPRPDLDDRLRAVRGVVFDIDGCLVLGDKPGGHDGGRSRARSRRWPPSAGPAGRGGLHQRRPARPLPTSPPDCARSAA